MFFAGRPKSHPSSKNPIGTLVLHTFCYSPFLLVDIPSASNESPMTRPILAFCVLVHCSAALLKNPMLFCRQFIADVSFSRTLSFIWSFDLLPTHSWTFGKILGSQNLKKIIHIFRNAFTIWIIFFKHFKILGLSNKRVQLAFSNKMHSWYRSLILRSLLFPAAGITISFDTNEIQQQRRRSSPTMKTRSQNGKPPLCLFTHFCVSEKSPVKQWSPTLLATALVVSDHQTPVTNNNANIQREETEAQNQSKWTTCNPLVCSNSTQITPSSSEHIERQEEEERRSGNNSNVFLSATSSM